MSLFNHATVTCPHCAAQFDVEVVASINADRRPDLRQQIIDGTFQAATCPKCATRFRLPPAFTYVDVGRGQWVLAYADYELENWPVLETQAATVFARSYGDEAPAAAREIGAGLTQRITFGWPALREKLIAHEMTLDDVTLELLKIAVMRNVQKPPFADETELRLVGPDDGALKLAWLDRTGERTLASLTVQRDIYDDIAFDKAAWADLRTQLAGHSFVDVDRLLVAPALAV